MASTSSEPEAEADNETLSLLAHLPDPSLALYPQYPTGFLTTFRSFPLLPQELRLLVFRFMFPRDRTLQIELSPHHTILHSHTPPPVTLFISHESRVETLKHYIPFLSTPSSTSRRKMLFHPAFDIIYFHRRRHEPLKLFQSTEYVMKESRASLALIKRLKVGEMWYGGAMKCWIRFGVCRKLWGGMTETADSGGLRFFSGLEELILVTAKKKRDRLFDVYDDGYDFMCAERLDTEELIQDCRKDFRGYFEWEREVDGSCKVPNVVVRQGRCRRLDKWYIGRLESWEE